MSRGPLLSKILATCLNRLSTSKGQFWAYSPRALETARGGSRIGREWAWAGARVSWIAPERLGRSGRETAHSIRRNGGTTMAAVTWSYVTRGTCHAPPREPFEKCCVRAAAQTGSGREPKLSGQKRLGLSCVPFYESAPKGQNCAPRGQFCFFILMPST